jgi:hypothetical protein
VLHSIALSSLEAISIRLSGPFGLIGWLDELILI